MATAHLGLELGHVSEDANEVRIAILVRLCPACSLFVQKRTAKRL